MQRNSSPAWSFGSYPAAFPVRRSAMRWPAAAVAYGDPDGGNGPGHGRRDVQRGFVRLQGDQRIFVADHVTSGHMHLDHWHVNEMADIGDRYLDNFVSPARGAVAWWFRRRGGRVLGDALLYRPRGRAARPRSGVEPQDEVPGRYPVTDPGGDFAGCSRDRRGNVQCGLVRLQRDERILGGYYVADGHMHLDDQHVDEVADVGNGDIHVRLQGGGGQGLCLGAGQSRNRHIEVFTKGLPIIRGHDRDARQTR